jgi:hypothetical protein
MNPMRGALICDIRHWIDVDPATELPRGLLRRRAFLGHIISAVTTVRDSEFVSGIPCQRRPRSGPCRGLIAVETEEDESEPFIYWWCHACGDNGRISGFRGSWYDLGRYRDRRADAKHLLPLVLACDEYAALLSEKMSTYCPATLRVIYSAHGGAYGVVLIGDERDVDLLTDAVAADVQREKKSPRRALLRSVCAKLQAARTPIKP